jgi:hypothetical protein
MLGVQVGIVAVNILGERVEAGSVPDRFWSEEGGTTTTSSGRGDDRRRKPDPGPDDLSVDMGLDPETASLFREVHARKIKAVEAEDFPRAKAYKEAEDMLRSLGGRLAVLLDEKRRAIDDEDYDRAAAIKAQIDGMKGEILSRVRSADSAHFPGHSHHHVDPYGAPPPVSAGGYGGLPPPGYGPPPVYPPTSTGGYRAPPPADVPPPARMSFDRSAPHASFHPDVRGGEVGKRLEPSTTGWNDREVERVVVHGAVEPEKDDFGGFGGTDMPEDLPPPPRRSPPRAKAGASSSATPGEARAIRPAGEGLEFFERKHEGEQANDAEMEPAGPTADEAILTAVPNASTLPAPEKLTAQSSKQAGDVVDVFGEYIARCLVSKSWQLREAAIIQMANIVTEASDPPPAVSLRSFSGAVARVAGADRNVQVFVAGCKYLPQAAEGVQRDLSSDEIASATDSSLRSFTSHLSDNGIKQREAASAALQTMAGVVSPAVVAQLCMEPLSAKEASKPRPLQSRLQILTTLVREKRLLRSGVGPSELLAWSVDNKCHENKVAEVRDGAKALAVALFEQVGPSLAARMTHLKGLQRDEYADAFEKAAASGGSSAARSAAPAASKKPRGGGAPATDSRRPKRHAPPPDDDMFADDLGKPGDDDDYFGGLDDGQGMNTRSAGRKHVAAPPPMDDGDDFFDDGGLDEFDDIS